MKTRITDLFGIRYPIILPGMSWISVPDLVAAVSNAGGLGVLATGPLSTEETRTSIQKIRKQTDKPFGAGVTILMPGARENAEVVIEEKVPVVIFSLGRDKKLFQRIHDYGGKIVCTVTTARHAHAAIEAGADALSVIGYEAAGHGSLVSTLVLTPSIVDEVKVPVIAGGGIGDGRGLMAALALGADAVYMGTRLSMTKESPVHANSKNLTLLHGHGRYPLFRPLRRALLPRAQNAAGGKVDQAGHELSPRLSGFFEDFAKAEDAVDKGLHRFNAAGRPRTPHETCPFCHCR